MRNATWKMEKSPIDYARDAAVTVEIRDTNDSSSIGEIISMPDRLFLIKERSIWRIQLADEIDPDRINPRIPNSQQKLLARGTADSLVCRTLLQAKRLLKPAFLPDKCDTVEGMRLSLTFLQEIAALQDKADDFRSVIEGLNEVIDKNGSGEKGFIVPAVGDVSTRGKAFIQGADHAARTLWQMVRVFEPSLPLKVSWPKLKARLEASDDRAKQVAKVIDKLAIGFTFLRNTRNAVEHPKPGQEVIFHDYCLKADGDVHLPTIKVIEKDTPLSETELFAYFQEITMLLINAFEALLVNLCAIHIKPFTGFETVIMKLEPNERGAPKVAFSYAVWLGDRLVPYAD